MDVKKAVSEVWEGVVAESSPLDLERLIAVGERIAEALEQIAEGSEERVARAGEVTYNDVVQNNYSRYPEHGASTAQNPTVGFIARVNGLRRSSGMPVGEAVARVQRQMSDEQRVAIQALMELESPMMYMPDLTTRWALRRGPGQEVRITNVEAPMPHVEVREEYRGVGGAFTGTPHRAPEDGPEPTEVERPR